MDRIRVGVAGLRHGMASVKEVLTQDHFELTALCSRTREAYEYLCGRPIEDRLDSVTFTEPREILIEQCRSRMDFHSVAFYTDYDRFLQHEALDAVIIAVPISLNADFSVKALEQGKHVLASKPFALTLEGGLALNEAIRNSSRKFMINYEFRYSTLMGEIRRRVAHGDIGPLRLMWWNMFRMPFRAGYTRREISGGPFIAEVCHWFDLFHYFNGEEKFRKVCAFGGLDVLKGHQDFEDHAVFIAEYENSVRASLNFTYFTDQPRHNLFGLVGESGKITADTDEAGRYVLNNGAEQNRTEYTVNPRKAHQGHLGFDVAHRRFEEAIVHDRDINEEEAKRGFESLLIGLAARRSLEQGRVVRREEMLSENK